MRRSQGVPVPKRRIVCARLHQPEKGEHQVVQMHKLKEASIKAGIVLIPTYSMAYFTDKMVWVVPTLAATGFFAGTITFSEATTKRLEDDVDQDPGADVVESSTNNREEPDG